MPASELKFSSLKTEMGQKFTGLPQQSDSPGPHCGNQVTRIYVSTFILTVPLPTLVLFLPLQLHFRGPHKLNESFICRNAQKVSEHFKAAQFLLSAENNRVLGMELQFIQFQQLSCLVEWDYGFREGYIFNYVWNQTIERNRENFFSEF